jgi:hypothetical protein
MVSCFHCDAEELATWWCSDTDEVMCDPCFRFAVGSSVTFMVDGDGEQLTGEVVEVFGSVGRFELWGSVVDLVAEDVPAVAVVIEDGCGWLVPVSWVVD